MLKKEGFIEVRQGKTSHKRFKCGDYMVTISYNSGGNTVPKKTFKKSTSSSGIS